MASHQLVPFSQAEDAGFLSKEQKYHLKNLQAELDEILKRPFLPKGMSTKYPTKNADVLEFLQNDSDALTDLRKRNSSDAPKPSKKKKRKKKAFFYK